MYIYLFINLDYIILYTLYALHKPIQATPGDAVEELLNLRGHLHVLEVLRIIPR